MNTLVLVVCIAVSLPAVASVGVLWEQHEATAVYNDVGVSRLGYVVASTWLNEPEVAEVFKLDTGNKTVKSASDTVPTDDAYFQISISEFGTTAVASRAIGGAFSFTLYKWDVSSSNPNPDWTVTLDKSNVAGIGVSGDGSVIAVAINANVSYYQPPVFQILFLDGASGSETIYNRYTAPAGQVGSTVSLSGDGQYIAFLTAVETKTSETVYMNVVHLLSGSSHTRPIQDWETDHAYGSAFAISVDGKYVAAGQANSFTVYVLKNTSTVEYDVLFTINNAANWYVPQDSIAFSASGDTLAVGWINIDVPTLQPRVTAYVLPLQKEVFNYTYPEGTGSYQNNIASIAISESGKYIAVATWGTANQDANTEQLQVFSITSSKAPVYKLMTPGSMFDIGVAESSNGHGLIVSAAGKSVHANQMGNGGDLFTVEAVPPQDVDPLDKPALDAIMSAQINRNPASTWRAGRNERFAGKSLKDVKKLLGTHLKNTKKAIAATPAVASSSSAIPASFDSRTQWPKCIGPIRDQQQCGSCWAFGAAESFGDRVCIANKGTTPVVLSPEYLVDCDSKDFGCSGGWLLYAWQFIEKPGLVSDVCYPYVAGTGQAGKCSNTCTSKNGTFVHFQSKAGTIQELQTVTDIQNAILANGPVEAAFTVYSDFMNYQSGVYSHTTGIYLGGHAIKVLGWGSTGGVDYWICANSWGTTWGGLNGYFLIKRGTDECNLESNAITALPLTAARI